METKCVICGEELLDEKGVTRLICLSCTLFDYDEHGYDLPHDDSDEKYLKQRAVDGHGPWQTY